ncbi:MAG: hypothetical protein B7Y45_00895 [Sphingomonas sp. 28-66-16]|nr:MAG: hypothetical protein B7Y45_00895 [Sphingomonas sp. 28-66-16]
MIEMITGLDRTRRARLFEQMFADRKRVFIDWLGWDLPHRDGLEIDDYDDDEAIYLIVADKEGAHLGSVRLLKTERGHILSDLFPTLCEGPVPVGPRIREITRMCVSPSCPAEERLRVRQMLATALVRFAHATGLEAYTAVTGVDFMTRVAAVGWRCRPLGLPIDIAGSPTAALMIEIDDSTINEMRATGTLATAAAKPHLSVTEAAA